MAQKSNGKHFKQDGPAAATTETGYVPASAGAYSRTASHASRTTGRKSRGSRDPKPSRPNKQRRGRDVLSTLLIIAGVALLLVAGGMWGYAQYQYHVQDENNAKLAAYATVSDDAAQPPTIDWAGLKAVNADIVGWIYIPGTHVDFPVYQGDSNDTYLRTSA